MKRKEVTISLKRPIEVGDGVTVDEIVLREPNGDLVFEFGNPGQLMRTADGAMTYIENNDVIKTYAMRCIVKPDPLLALRGMSVLDTLAVREAIIGFFHEAPTESAT